MSWTDRLARRNLTPQEFVDAAFALVKSDGVGALTARNLAERVGVDSSAVYRHVENLEALGSAALDQVFAESAIDDLGDGSPRERLERFIENIHVTFVAHSPLLALALACAAPMPHPDLVSRRGLELLADLGLGGDELGVSFNMIESALMGLHLSDLVAAPHHLESRRVRWRRLENQELDQHATSTEELANMIDRSHRILVDSLIDRCESLVGTGSTRR